jgi:HAD superfamily hydrolase (TIGR01509 family)
VSATKFARLHPADHQTRNGPGMPVRAVLFDIDGTLVDSNDLHVLAWEAAFGSIGVTFDRQRIHDQIGKGADMLVPTLLPDADRATQERLGKIEGEVFQARFRDKAQPFAGAHALLARVHAAGQAAVLASSASAADVDHYLNLLGARELVAATTSADDVAHTKPAPDIFEAALKKVAPLTAAEVLVVGDTPYDVEAAAQCGIGTIAVRSGGFSDDALLRAGAIALYDDVAALLGDYDTSLLGSWADVCRT